jgi:hypothetical protein
MAHGYNGPRKKWPRRKMALGKNDPWKKWPSEKMALGKNGPLKKTPLGECGSILRGWGEAGDVRLKMSEWR